MNIANLTKIPSPALLIFPDRVDANLRRMIAIAGSAATLRPHVKTHKLAPIVARQVALGITKFKAATLAEAAMCAHAGAADVLLAYPPAGPTAARLCELVKQHPTVRFSTVADNPSAIRGLSVAARAAGVTLDVFLDIDCGMARTGVPPSDEALALWHLIEATPALRAAGLHAYDGHITTKDPGQRTHECDAAFAPVLALQHATRATLIIAGGTPTFPTHARHAGRECSPGTTTLWDFGYAEKFPDLAFEIAATLLARVVSRPRANRLCLDLGYKAVASENPLETRVRIPTIPDAKPIMHSEEHLVIETTMAGKFSIGEPLEILPRHICPTVALHDEATIVENGHATGKWPITARGRATWHPLL